MSGVRVGSWCRVVDPFFDPTQIWPTNMNHLRLFLDQQKVLFHNNLVKPLIWFFFFWFKKNHFTFITIMNLYDVNFNVGSNNKIFYPYEITIFPVSIKSALKSEFLWNLQSKWTSMLQEDITFVTKNVHHLTLEKMYHVSLSLLRYWFILNNNHLRYWSRVRER